MPYQSVWLFDNQRLKAINAEIVTPTTREITDNVIMLVESRIWTTSSIALAKENAPVVVLPRAPSFLLFYFAEAAS